LFNPFADGTYNGSGTIIDGTKVDDVVDSLLANGVIVPPCKVGDKVWDLHQRYNGTFVIQEGKISMLTQKADKSWHLRITVNSSVWGFTPNEIGTRYFLTKEEAEEKLRELGK
jgi:hypothetical protein